MVYQDRPEEVCSDFMLKQWHSAQFSETKEHDQKRSCTHVVLLTLAWLFTSRFANVTQLVSSNLTGALGSPSAFIKQSTWTSVVACSYFLAFVPPPAPPHIPLPMLGTASIALLSRAVSVAGLAGCSAALHSMLH